MRPVDPDPVADLAAEQVMAGHVEGLALASSRAFSIAPSAWPRRRRRPGGSLRQASRRSAHGHHALADNRGRIRLITADAG